ncbi:MAG: peptidylprolyl isomerase [Elusimicrobia bacterium HGW-Elusimicrobia-3]|nr:MAG: peptidylprolyl isomerase [Elusimicrobia bacterium HGW-Elusimicrobia-3]
MKRNMLIAIACLIAAPAFAADAEMTEDQKTLYFLGQAVSSKIKQFEFTPDETKFIVQGFSEALAGEKSKADETYGMKLNAYLAKKQEAIVAKQKEASKPFLEKMAKQKGAKKLPSGVIVIPMKEGKGAMPKATDMVKVHYHGTFPDGKVFDSSVERGQPAEFPLGGVITCWIEGVQKIKVGGKAKLVCPSDTAYGDQGAGGTIPGGATLVFEVELLEIPKEEAAPKAPKKPEARKEAKPAAKADAKK